MPARRAFVARACHLKSAAVLLCYECVSQLSVGDRAKITIPPTKGYGKKGFPGLIAPNAKMVFDVEMLSCVDVSED